MIYREKSLSYKILWDLFESYYHKKTVVLSSIGNISYTSIVRRYAEPEPIMAQAVYNSKAGTKQGEQEIYISHKTTEKDQFRPIFAFSTFKIPLSLLHCRKMAV